MSFIIIIFINWQLSQTKIKIMQGIKATLVPNQETDYQAFSFDELGLTYFEWKTMCEADKRILILENIMENICSHIDIIEEY